MNAITPIALSGEIVGPADDVRVVIATHPLRHERKVLAARAGDTLADMVATAIAAVRTKHIAADFVAHLDGHRIEPALWPRVRPKPGTTLVLRPVAKGLLAPLLGLVSSAFGAAGGFLSGIFGKLLMAGISMAAKFLLNALFAPKQDRPQLAAAKPGFSIAGSRNQAAQFASVPVILGRHRVTPAYGAAPYTEIVGEDQYLRLLFVVGYGPLDISEIKIGETPISSFSDVSVETRQGLPGDTATSLYPTQVVEEQLGIEMTFAAGYQSRTTADNVTEVQIDMMWPQGLYWMSDKGNREWMGTGFRWEYRPASGGGWTTIQTVSFIMATPDMIRRTYRVVLPAGKWEIRVIRTTADPVSDRVVDTMRWTAIRGIRTGQPITFADKVALIALRIRATSQLNGVVDTLNCIATSLVWDWNGSSWAANTASRNPASLFRHVLQSAANKRPVSDARIDLASLQGWHAYCASSGWTYDKPINSAVSVLDTLLEVCAAGRAVPIFRDGKWSVVWDEQDTPVVQMFTPRNSWGFEAQQRFQDLPHAFRVRFPNAEKGFVEDERIVYDDGYSAANATQFEGLDLPGVTNTDAVWKHGRYHIAQLRLRPAMYTLMVDFEGLVLNRADRVRVQHDVMLLGLSAGRVVAVDAGTQTVTVDERLTLSPSDTYAVRFRLADGGYVLRTIVPGTFGEVTELPLSGADDLPEAGDLFAFGVAGSETAVYRVLGIEPQGDFVHRLTLVDDAPDIYLADTGAIPEYNAGITAPVDPFTLPPVDLVISDRAYEESGVFQEELIATWKLPRAGHVDRVEVEYRGEDGVWRSAPPVFPPATTASVFGLVAGPYSMRVRSIFTDGSFSNWNTSAVYSAVEMLNPPGDIAAFNIATIGDISTLTWSPVSGVGIRYQIRFAPASVIAPTWATSSPLMSNLDATTIQVPTMVGSYFIKAVKPSGTVSTNAASIQTAIAALTGLNVIETITESPTFAGNHQDVEVVDGEMRLLSRNVMANWETLAAVISLYEGDGESDSLGYEAEGIYTFAEGLDLGDVYTSRITATVDAYGFDPATTMAAWLRLSDVATLDQGEPGDWGVTLECRTTLVDPVTDDWTAWQAFVVGDLTFRAIEFRLFLRGRLSLNQNETYAVATPSVRGLSVQIDMPDRIVADNDILVPDTGLYVAFDPPFAGLSGLGIAAQDLATGDRAVIDAKDEAGFNIIFRNSGGAAVARTFDYVAKGYGRLHA